MRTGTLTIEYEIDKEDVGDPNTSDYIGVLSVTNGSNEKLILRNIDIRMLEEVLLKIYHHSTV